MSVEDYCPERDNDYDEYTLDFDIQNVIEVKQIKDILNEKNKPELVGFLDILINHINYKVTGINPFELFSEGELITESEEETTDEEWTNQNA